MTTSPIGSLLTCTGCGVAFTGDRQRRYCTDQCRWRTKAKRSYKARPAPTKRKIARACEECGGTHYARGLCSRHYRVKYPRGATLAEGVPDQSAQDPTPLSCLLYVIACEQCAVVVSRQRSARYCSVSCSRSAYRLANPERFEYKPRDPKCITCGGRCEEGKRACDDCREANQRRNRRAHDQRRRAAERDANAERVIAERVYARDGWTCGLCLKSVDSMLSWPHPRSASLDHVLPLSKGGTHTYANTQLAHLDCNVAKGDRVEG